MVPNFPLTSKYAGHRIYTAVGGFKKLEVESAFGMSSRKDVISSLTYKDSEFLYPSRFTITMHNILLFNIENLGVKRLNLSPLRFKS